MRTLKLQRKQSYFSRRPIHMDM